MEQEKSLFKAIFGSFLGKDGYLSHSKIMTLIGFICFISVSIIILYTSPDKFNYELFAILSGGGAVGGKIIDKWLNIKASKGRK